MLKISVCSCTLLLIFGTSLARDYQRYNANTDFLLHEAGAKPNDPKRNLITNQPSQAPSTSPTIVNNGPGGTTSTHKSPSHNMQSSGGKRDYVSNFPQLRPSVQPQTASTGTTSLTHNTQNSGGKRDYVAPQYPTSKPAFNNQQSTSKVKDLVNFYDNKDKDKQTPQAIPSYSSILQGTTNKNTPTLAPSFSSTKYVTPQTTPKSPMSPTKPLSFSAIVAGSNKPGTTSTIITPKPGTFTPVVPTVPTSRPSSPVLPSTILNNNKNQAGSNIVTDDEIALISEELLRKDINNAAKYVTVNYQEKTTSQSKEDKASQALLTIAPEAWNIPTIQKFVPLLDNYERDTLINEHVTPQERNEEIAFMDEIMSTTVIRHLMNFLKEKGYVTPDPRQQKDFLKQLWFGLYSRGKGKISSSGFEHVFVSELKNGEVSGLHNWIYFSKEEAVNRINYLGYLKYLQLNEKGVVLKLHFNQQGVDKPVDSMFIGTSPELEMALYTLCFVTRADNDCKLKLANKDVTIITHTFRYRSKNMIGSAYPQI